MDGYRLFIKPFAVKELVATPHRDRLRIVARIRALARDPRPHGWEKLSGEEKYRLRQGDYRVVYQISEDGRAVTIFKIGHRREVYR